MFMTHPVLHVQVNDIEPAAKVKEASRGRRQCIAWIVHVPLSGGKNPIFPSLARLPTIHASGYERDQRRPPPARGGF